MSEQRPYEQFLKGKVRLAQSTGFDIEDSEINPALKPHNRLMVKWMVEGGRRACFASFGLHKTVTQLEAIRIILTKTGGRALIIAPLGVRQEFRRDAVQLLGWNEPPKFIRRIEEAGETGIYITNYETVRDGKLDPRLFQVATLDEASVLRGFGGTKTFREFMRLFTGDAGPKGDRRGTACVPYRFVATATPSPNDYIELLAYADFLGIMDVSQAKTRFFKRDSTQADKLTLHTHKEEEFWLWVASWALFVTKPSDLTGNPQDDEGYILPQLDIRWHELPSDHSAAGADRSGQGLLFKTSALGLDGAAREKRESLTERVAKVLELRAEDPAAHRVIWHDLEAERHLIEELFPVMQFNKWDEYKDGHPIGLELYNRHYSAYQYKDGRERKLFCGPGQKTVLISKDQKALFVWRNFIDASGQKGVNCAVFRNEQSQFLSSDLIKEAMAIAWLRWPGERLYTYVNADKVKSNNPGYCFKKAGWKFCGKTQGGLDILEVLPGTVETLTINPLPGCKTVYGKQDLEEREEIIAGFSVGDIPEIAGKPCMIGSGTNLQRFCHWGIYTGIGFKFNDFIQSIHRLLRFLQTHRVRIDLIYTEAEREVRRALERKWEQHNKLVKKMTDIIQQFGLSQAAMVHLLSRKMGVERMEIKGANYTIVNNDCVLETKRLDDNSVGLILTSIPFSTQYEYSPNYADFGHSDSNEQFFHQMDYLIPELLRVLKPGRIAAIHVKDRIIPGGLSGLGFQTAYPFHMDTKEAFTTCPDCRIRIALAKYNKESNIAPCQHWFSYMGMKTIVTDVVRENKQTYRLGWTEQCKDGSKMGVGMPEYLLLLRKPQTNTEKAYADEPVVKNKPLQVRPDGTTQEFNRDENLPLVPRSGYSRSRWQVDAHGFARSAGERLMDPEELQSLDHDIIFKLFKQYSLETVYNFEHHVKIGEMLEGFGRMPTTFMLLQPQSWSDEVWTDITRMLTLNGSQWSRGKEMHLCLAKGSLVLTYDGYKPIEELQFNDLVLTHEGRWKPVVSKIPTGIRSVVKLSAQGVADLQLTPDHEIWTRIGRTKHPRTIAKASSPKWVEAKDTLGSYVNLKLPPVQQSKLTEEEWWIVGRWLGDGHIHQRGYFIISCGNHEFEELKGRLGKYVGVINVTQTCHQITLKGLSRPLKQVLKRCGSHASGKVVPGEAVELDREYAEALLSGYLSADGGRDKQGRYQATSVSKALLLGMAMIVQRARNIVASVYPGRPAGETTIQDRKVKTQQEWHLHIPTGNRSAFIQEDGAWKKVRSIETCEEEVEVWDIKVADDASFTAEGCVVHNCPMQFDIADRVIEQMSNEGDIVLDPFGGLMTVPYRAVLKKRYGIGFELNPSYFVDGAAYCKAAETQTGMPTLFDTLNEAV